MGTRTLNINTPGRTKISFTSYTAEGTFSYTMKPASKSTNYTVRAYLKYTDVDGRVIYEYSDPLRVSYNTAK